MRIVRRYTTPLQAEAAAEFLRQSSIAARTSSHSGVPGLTGYEVFDVAVLDDSHADRARELLMQFEAAPPDLDAAWESATRPDLSRLDHGFAPSCPACAAALPIDDVLAACPACRAPVSVVDLIFKQHGPDALATCYPNQAAAPLPGDLLESASIFCPACRYPLAGLPAEGPCPECGLPYSKAELLRGPGT